MRYLGIAAVVAIFMGFFVLFVFSSSLSGDNQATFNCRTHGAQLVQSTKDNDLHITIWCVKNGVVVP